MIRRPQTDERTLVVAGDPAGALYCLELVEPVGQWAVISGQLSVGSRVNGRFADEPAYGVK